MKKIVTVVGARPQFIKHAPVEIALKKLFEVVSVHTGQHYDERMSDIFFNQLNISAPKYMLDIGSHSHGKQTAGMLEKIEEILLAEKPDGLLVYGDTNSTLAGALAAAKLNIPIIHVEAGLRSYNKTMPEEVNRILTDHVSDILFAPTVTAVENLEKENITNNVFNVGDVMYDSLLLALNVIDKEALKNNYILCTLHRPYNTDHIERLLDILNVLNKLAYEIVFPVHPRTLNILKKNNIAVLDFSNIQFIDPVSYFDLVSLQIGAKCIITDSGGIQKEAYMLKKKCITLRTETEWIETLQNGWNTLVFDNLEDIINIVDELAGAYVEDIYGSGNAAQEMAEIIAKAIN